MLFHKKTSGKKYFKWSGNPLQRVDPPDGAVTKICPYSLVQPIKILSFRNWGFMVGLTVDLRDPYPGFSLLSSLCMHSIWVPGV